MKIFKKKGMKLTSALGSIILLLITLWVMFSFGPKIYSGVKFFTGDIGSPVEDEQKSLDLSDPGIQKFNEFIASYKKCKSYSSDKCICGSFDYTLIPEGYTIKLENLQTEKTKMTRIELNSNEKETSEKVETIDNDILCFYNLVGGKFEKVTAQDMDLSENVYNNYKAENKVQLFKFDKENTCFVQKTGREGFQALTSREVSCELKAQEKEDVKLAMLDIGKSSIVGGFNGERNSAKLLEELEKNLLNIMKVSRITEEFASVTTRFERRKTWFEDKYKKFDRNNNGLLNDDIVLISISGLHRNIKETIFKNDLIIVRYLKGSEESKKLAENIAQKLNEVTGKFIKDEKEFKEGEVDRRYEIKAKADVIEGTSDNPQSVFLACQEDYKDFIACKENTKIPAVFIELFEIEGDGAYMFAGHYNIFAQKISEGVQEYLS